MKMHVTFGILLLIVDLSRTLAGRENILSIPKKESWISTENFTTMIKKSFLYAKCCNIYLSESIHSVEVLFNQFRNIYPYDYLLRKKIYECQGYFLLGPTDKEIGKAMQKVPSSISTTEILIVVDSELKNNSELFDVSLYGNSNANIVSRSGIWALSENYLEPRFFVKVDTYEELAGEFDIIDMRGRELQVSTFYRPPMIYVSRMIEKVINGTVEEVFPADNALERDGIEMKIFLIIAEKLNFTWTLRKPRGEYRYGRRNDTTWNGGVIELLIKKEIDMAFGSIWLTADTNIFVNMSEPWYQLFIHFVVPRPRPITSFWALTRPFSVDVWLLLLIMLFTKSIYMYARARLDEKFPKRFRNFVFTITELIGRLLGTWVPRNTANARFELHLWQTVSVVLVTAYSSSLAARLASWEYEDRIDTVRQFLENNLSWGRKGKPPPYQDYFDMDDFYSSQLPSRFIPVKDDEMTHDLINDGNYAIIGRIVGSIYFPEDDVLNEDLKNYRVMKQTVGNFYSSFAVQPWLLHPINTIILWLRESGITYFHLDDVIRRRASITFHEVLKEYDGHDGGARVLKLMPLGVGFTTLILGLLISTIVFVYELKHAAGTRRIHEVFREIQKKRDAYKRSACKRKYRKESTERNLSEENFDSFVIKSAVRTVDNWSR